MDTWRSCLCRKTENSIENSASLGGSLQKHTFWSLKVYLTIFAVNLLCGLAGQSVSQLVVPFTHLPKRSRFLSCFSDTFGLFYFIPWQSSGIQRILCFASQFHPFFFVLFCFCILGGFSRAACRDRSLLEVVKMVKQDLSWQAALFFWTLKNIRHICL